MTATPAAPSAHFVRGIKSNLAHWRNRLNHEPQQVAAEHPHLLQAVEYGLVLPETERATAELTLQSFPAIEEWGQWHAWIPVLQRLATALSTNGHPLRVHMLNRLGRCLYLNRELGKAVAIYEEAEREAKQSAEQPAVAETHLRLSEAYLALHQYAVAEQYGRLALAEFERMEDSEAFRASTLNVLGLLALERGELESAEENLQQAAILWRSLDRPLPLARVLKNLGFTLQRNEKLDEATRCYQEALHSLERTTSKLDQIEVQNNIGIIYFKRRRYEQAEAIFRQAHHAVQALNGNFQISASLAQNLGNSIVRQGRFIEAEAHFRRGLLLWQQFNNELEQANTLGGLGDALARQEKRESALLYYAEALKLLEKFPENAWAKKLLAEFMIEIEVINSGGHPQPL